VKLGVKAALSGRDLIPGDIEIVDGRVTRLGIASANGRGLAVPGFIDLQVNGFAGVNFATADASGYARAGEALLETGVTAYLPTLITAPEAGLVASLEEVPVEAPGARILGVHLEGPFLAPEQIGAHPIEWRRDPDRPLLELFLGAGPIILVTLAPELPGALDLIDLLHERGIHVALGHTNATAAEAEAAFERGVRTVTHLFNAMRPFHHRDPGIVGAALNRDDVLLQLILDGHHVAAAAAQLVWRVAPNRIALVTDAMAGAGQGDGRYLLGETEIEVSGGITRRPDGGLGGSVLTMVEALRNLHALGVSLADAVRAATAIPARIIGRPELGCLEPGARADVVVLDDNLEVERVLIGGEARVAA
jgi:N-acetylglucosamine-6-phosphate deacetylase